MQVGRILDRRIATKHYKIDNNSQAHVLQKILEENNLHISKLNTTPKLTTQDTVEFGFVR